jgi:hypothetical protein
LVTVEIVGPNWDKLIKRYINATDKVGLVSAGVVKFMQREAIKEAQHQLDVMVYSQPLQNNTSQNDYSSRGRFMGTSIHARTGNTRRAVLSRNFTQYAHGASGEVYVDPEVANRDGFFYPAILNRGISGTRYYARPFWSAMEALIRVKFAKTGRAALKKLRLGFDISVAEPAYDDYGDNYL